MFAAPVFGDQGIHTLDHGGQETAAQRRIRHETDAQFAAGRQDAGFDIAAPQRVFGFNGDDRVHRMRAAQGGRRHL